MLVVAAPHSKCKGPSRDCDTDAKKITLSLIQKARRSGIKTKGCLANKYRHDVDNNRKGSEGSDFRKDLDTALRADGIFLEIHSHPNVDRFGGKRMTIFNLPKNRRIAKKLYYFLNDDTIGIQDGEPVMDIQQNYRGLMLEFNEGYPHEDILNKIIEFVKIQEPSRMKGGQCKLSSISLFICIFCAIVLLFILVATIDFLFSWFHTVNYL